MMKKGHEYNSTCSCASCQEHWWKQWNQMIDAFHAGEVKIDKIAAHALHAMWYGIDQEKLKQILSEELPSPKSYQQYLINNNFFAQPNLPGDDSEYYWEDMQYDDRIAVKLDMSDWDTFVKEEVSRFSLFKEPIIEEKPWAHSLKFGYDVSGRLCYVLTDTKSGLSVKIPQVDVLRCTKAATCEVDILAVCTNKDIYETIMLLAAAKLQEAYDAIRE